MDIRQHDDQGDHRRPDHGLFNGVHHPCAKGNMLALIAGGDRHQYHHQRQLEDVCVMLDTVISDALTVPNKRPALRCR